MTADETAKIVKKSPTDSDRNITFDRENRPGVSALLTTAALCSGRAETDIAAEIGDGVARSSALRHRGGQRVFRAHPRARREELTHDMDYVRGRVARGQPQGERDRRMKRSPRSTRRWEWSTSSPTVLIVECADV